MTIYKRFGRVSFYLGTGIFWLRVRSRQMLPDGFFFKIGRDGIVAPLEVRAGEWMVTMEAKRDSTGPEKHLIHNV